MGVEDTRATRRHIALKNRKENISSAEKINQEVGNKYNLLFFNVLKIKINTVYLDLSSNFKSTGIYLYS